MYYYLCDNGVVEHTSIVCARLILSLASSHALHCLRFTRGIPSHNQSKLLRPLLSSLPLIDPLRDIQQQIGEGWSLF